MKYSKTEKRIMEAMRATGRYTFEYGTAYGKPIGKRLWNAASNLLAIGRIVLIRKEAFLTRSKKTGAVVARGDVLTFKMWY